MLPAVVFDAKDSEAVPELPEVNCVTPPVCWIGAPTGIYGKLFDEPAAANCRVSAFGSEMDDVNPPHQYRLGDVSQCSTPAIVCVDPDPLVHDDAVTGHVLDPPAPAVAVMVFPPVVYPVHDDSVPFVVAFPFADISLS